jgi:prepilin-type N-terminal cleavage/methylation domain-containing protein
MRRGFTVVELLVVIAIIGVLTALTLPAVQMAREASRLASCRNNLKQIAVAAAAHSEAFEYFPNAGGRDGQPRSMTAPTGGIPKRSLEQDWGWAYQILPYIEKQDVYINSNDAEVAGLKFKGYFCPTRRPPKTVSGSTQNGLAASVQRGGLDYAGSGGFSVAAFPSTQSLSNQSGAIIPRPGIPMVTTERISAQSIRDGLSNVIMFGERNFSRKPEAVTQQDEDNGYFNGWSWDTIRWGTRRPAKDRPTGLPGEATGGPSSPIPAFDHRFGSSHSGVCLLAMCDGSVKTFRYAQNYATAAHSEDEVFRQLVHRFDNVKPASGMPIPNPQLE